MICVGMKKIFSLPPFGGASVQNYAKIMVGGNPYPSFFFSYFFIPAMGASFRWCRWALGNWRPDDAKKDSAITRRNPQNILLVFSIDAIHKYMPFNSHTLYNMPLPAA